MREASTAPFAFYSIPRVKLYMHTLACLGYIWLLVGAFVMSTDLSTGELPTDMRIDELLFHGDQDGAI